MNEQIVKLIDQSGFGSYAEIPDTYIVHKNDLVEFAELIVKECGHYMVDIMLFGGIEPEQGYDIMLKHFGVEQ